MGGTIRIIESNQNFSIVEKDFIDWLDKKDESWWRSASLLDDKESVRQSISMSIQEFNETHHIHNNGSAGPSSNQYIMLEYITKNLGYKVYSFDVYSDDIIAIISPGVKDLNLTWNYDGVKI